MDIVSSYSAEILKVNRIFRPTEKIYKKALAYLINVVNQEWKNIKVIQDSQKRQSHLERLIHSTKDNTAKYQDFDILFHKMPSYLRRSVINEAIGAVSSYKSLYENWLKDGKKGKEPKLQFNRNNRPVFYNYNMYKETNDPCVVQLKLYNGADWVWFDVKLKKTDINYIRKYWTGKDESAPMLEKRHRKYYLRFAFKERVSLNNTNLEDKLICSVDLGINTDAVCTVMDYNGTVAKRKFINFPADKDRIFRILNRIRKKQKLYSRKSVSSLWAYVKRLNDELARNIAKAITEFAVEQNCSVIVFEHLDMKNKKKGKSNKQKIHMWKKNTIQNLVEHKAHRYGLRISRVSAINTSKLAFDGSGLVKRDASNYSLSTFSTGKQYNCDLSASYNIGARYFLREIYKTLPETVGSLLEAKVPEVKRRTLATLSTLFEVHDVLREDVLAA